MHHAELTTQTRAAVNEHERSELAAIMGEVCVRLLEMAEMHGEDKVQVWLLRLCAMFRSEVPRSTWIYLRLCTGDLSEVTASHAEHGRNPKHGWNMHRSKQGEHKEHKEALRVIARHFPELAEAIKELENKTKAV